MKRLAFLIPVIILGAGIAFFALRTTAEEEPIRVGVLHSLTGTMAISETSVVDATLLAIEEINDSGGINGRQIEPILVDGQSDWDTFASEADRLIVVEGVDVIFGCWTSACRKTVRPVFEARDHLLIYPVQYEGLEDSPNIIYTGAAPNQQIIPAVSWALDNIGSSAFLVGSDYVFPRTANEIIRAQLRSLNGTVAGEEYILLGSSDVDAAVAAIVETQPDVILNTINGDSNIAFFRALREAGITPDVIPTISFSIAEPELQTLIVGDVVGDYAVWNYFQSVDRAENRDFVQRFKDRYGQERVVSDPMEAAYSGVYLWAQAVEEAGTADPTVVRRAMHGQSFNAPQGIVSVDPASQHVWKTVRVGQIQADGQFEVVWDSENPIRPLPFPIYRTPSEWNNFLETLFVGWDNQWENLAQETTR